MSSDSLKCHKTLQISAGRPCNNLRWFISANEVLPWPEMSCDIHECHRLLQKCAEMSCNDQRWLALANEVQSWPENPSDTHACHIFCGNYADTARNLMTSSFGRSTFASQSTRGSDHVSDPSLASLWSLRAPFKLQVALFLHSLHHFYSHIIIPTKI